MNNCICKVVATTTINIPRTEKLLVCNNTLKLPKTLKDMTLRLCKRCENDEATCRKLCVCGFVCSNLQLQVLFMVVDKGSVCRIIRSNVYEIPEDISLFIKNINNIIKLVWKAKQMMLNSHEIISNYGADDLFGAKSNEKIHILNFITTIISDTNSTTSNKRRKLNQE